MRTYDDFVDRGFTRYLPYLMYFHRASYASEVVNTDRLGFRFSVWGGRSIAPTSSALTDEPFGILVGSSTAFGVGASSDAGTLASRLADRTGMPWLNFGGRGYNSLQEWLLLELNRHRLPKPAVVLVLSGVNNLVLAGLPGAQSADYPPFFFSGEYHAQMEALKEKHRGGRTRGRRERVSPPADPHGDAPSLSTDERIDLARWTTASDLDRWVDYTRLTGVPVQFALQSLATWVKPTLVREEVALFEELDAAPSNFWRLFGDVLDPEIGRSYGSALLVECANRGIAATDLLSSAGAGVNRDEWLFVDRAHLNDRGYDFLAALLVSRLDLARWTREEVRDAPSTL